MNTRTALIALVVTLLVAGGAFFLMKPKPAAADGSRTWLASVDAGQVTEIAVKSKDDLARLERSVVPDVWLLKVASSTGEEVAWPVDGKKVSAAVKLLGDVERSSMGEPGSTTGAEVSVTLAGGMKRKVSFGSAVLAGKVLVKIEGAPDSYRMADAKIASVFTPEGLRAWRDKPALTSAAGEFSRVRLSATGREVIVAKVAGKWGVQSPVVAPADIEACAKLGSALSEITIERFIDQPPGGDAAMGLTTPAAIIDTQSDFRIAKGGDVERRVLIQQVKLGGLSDATGKKLFASIRAQWLNPTTRTVEAAWGPVLVEVKSGDFGGLTAELPVFVSKQAVQAPSADVSTVTLVADTTAMQRELPANTAAPRQVKATRYLETWHVFPVTGVERDATGTEVRGIDLVLSLLCEQSAIAVGKEPPADTTGVMRLKVEATGASEEVGVGLAEVTIPAANGEPATKKIGIVLRVGAIYRVYVGPRAEEAVRWMGEELPPE